MNDLTVFENLKNSDMINEEDVNFLNEHVQQFEKRFKTRSLFRSKTEMEAGVLNDDEHPTPDSKYWQAIGEQNVHLTELINLDFESKKIQADCDIILAEIDELKIELNSLSEDEPRYRILKAKIKKKEIEYNQTQFNLIQQLKTAKERMREIKNWEEIIISLEPLLKYGSDNFELHHPERYYLRYRNRVEHLDLLPQDSRENVLSHFKSFSNYIEQSEPQLIKGNDRPMIENDANMNCETIEEMKEKDPIVKKYFSTRTRKILVFSPHRRKEDKNCTNLFYLQIPAGYSSMLEEPYGYLVSDAQNFIVQKAIDEGYDYIFSVEDDNLIPKNALVQLIKHDVDIAGGIYYRKYFPLETAGMHYDKDGYPGSIDYKMGDIIHNTLVLPMGCTLIKVEALKKMSPPWFKTITITGKPAITSDTYICEKIREIGGDIVTDTGVQCLHIDTTKGIIYGHPDIVKNNIVVEEWRDYFAI